MIKKKEYFILKSELKFIRLRLNNVLVRYLLFILIRLSHNS